MKLYFPKKKQQKYTHTHTLTHTRTLLPTAKSHKTYHINTHRQKTSKNVKEMNLKTAEKVKVYRGRDRGRCCRWAELAAQSTAKLASLNESKNAFSVETNTFWYCCWCCCCCRAHINYAAMSPSRRGIGERGKEEARERGEWRGGGECQNCPFVRLFIVFAVVVVAVSVAAVAVAG